MLDGMLRSITTLDRSDPELLARVMKDMVFGGLLAVGLPRLDGRARHRSHGMTDMTAVGAARSRLVPSEEAFRQEVLTFLRGHAAGEG